MSDEGTAGLSESEQQEAQDAIKSRLEEDEEGRPVFPVSEEHQKAMEQGYRGLDGADLGHESRPEDTHTFSESIAEMENPAPVERVGSQKDENVWPKRPSPRPAEHPKNREVEASDSGTATEETQ